MGEVGKGIRRKRGQKEASEERGCLLGYLGLGFKRHRF